MGFRFEERLNSAERNERKLCRYLGVSELVTDDYEEKAGCLDRVWKGRRYWMKVYVNEYRRRMIWELYSGMNIPKANRSVFEEYLRDCRQRTKQICLQLDRYGDVKVVGSFDIGKCVWSDRDFEKIEDALFDEIDCRIDLIRQLSKR